MKKNIKAFPILNTVIVCVIVLLMAGLFLLERYKRSGYVYEGEYLYYTDDRHMIIDVEYSPDRDVLYIDFTDIYRAEIYDNAYCDIVSTEKNLELPMSDMDAALQDKANDVMAMFPGYDLYIDLISEQEKEYDFETAKDLVLKALSVLGEDYIKVLTN